MRKLGTKNKKKNAALVIILAVFTVIGLLHFIGAFQYLENMSYDLRVRQFAAPTPASDEIIVILLDQDSLDWAQEERGWGWPWPRQAYAEMLDFMNLGEANSFAFDVIYSEPSIYRNSKQDVIVDAAMNDLKTAVTAITEDRLTEDRFTEKDAETAVPLINNVIDSLHELNNQEDDASFVRAQTEYGRAIQGVLFSTRSGSAYSWPDGLETPVFEADKESFGDFLQQFGLGANETTLDKAVFPIKELRESAGALGSITGIPDSDGVIRRLRLFTFFDNKAVPALGAASLLVSGSSPNITFNPKTSSIQWDDFSIPVDKNGTSLLRYRGRLDNYYPYSIKEILLSAEAVKKGEESFLYPEDFTGRFVFFGFYAEGLYDIFSTPISSVYPGMGVHITMLDNILMGDFIRESEEWLNIIILFFAVSITILLCIFTSRIYISVGGMLIAVAGVVFAAFAAYNTGSLWLPMVVHIAGIITAFISATIYNFVTEGSQKRFIKSAFSQYLSPKVIDRIIADPSQLKLGGEKREMTAIFTDVRSFSTISEALGDPQKLVELLNHYLTRMSNIVLENQGTIDKYEGDAIIAFFGAPVHMENHASLACRSAVLMKKTEVVVNKEALDLGLVNKAVMEAMFNKGIIKKIDDPCPLFTRLGINSGSMVVGNMGTPNKMDYTIMGNAVNLSARLEGVNKQYNTGGILISEYTREQIGDDFVLRPLSRVRVVGINTPLRLYELLDIKNEAKPELLEMVKSWEQAFTAYEQRNFASAAKIFQEICGQNQDDLCAKKYYDRCNKFITAPPVDAQWDDGVDNLTEK